MFNLLRSFILCVVFWVFSCLSLQATSFELEDIIIISGGDVGKTSDPSVNVIITDLLRPEIAFDEQIVCVKIVCDSLKVVDKAVLFLLDGENRLIVDVPVKSTMDGDKLVYSFNVKKPFLENSVVHLSFKGKDDKRIVLKMKTKP
ncbi:hypothetical protein JIN85_15625 [Luteolibacter pohnpeiensis]|uniref:Uncharacterized protein n=1 Tax=Luteolibacter pohnpeiensis TaxID=454153 RepID=A0A934S7Y8_9BACT|nr:hypothetical protein [Luteolibacter pohnpeiensis]MBK1883847.1 hypothetical protein [Luteolibacter pohnpeiensis]